MPTNADTFRNFRTMADLRSYLTSLGQNQGSSLSETVIAVLGNPRTARIARKIATAYDLALSTDDRETHRLRFIAWMSSCVAAGVCGYEISQNKKRLRDETLPKVKDSLHRAQERWSVLHLHRDGSHADQRDDVLASQS